MFLICVVQFRSAEGVLYRRNDAVALHKRRRRRKAIITALHMIMENLEVIKGGYAARIKCWEHTRMLADAFAEPPPSYKYKHVATPPNRGHPTMWETKIDVEDIDSIDCGLALQEQGLNPRRTESRRPVVSRRASGLRCRHPRRELVSKD